MENDKYIYTCYWLDGTWCPSREPALFSDFSAGLKWSFKVLLNSIKKTCVKNSKQGQYFKMKKNFEVLLDYAFVKPGSLVFKDSDSLLTAAEKQNGVICLDFEKFTDALWSEFDLIELAWIHKETILPKMILIDAVPRLKLQPKTFSVEYTFTPEFKTIMVETPNFLGFIRSLSNVLTIA